VMMKVMQPVITRNKMLLMMDQIFKLKPKRNF